MHSTEQIAHIVVFKIVGRNDFESVLRTQEKQADLEKFKLRK